MAGERWIFTRSQLVNTPSRRCGIDSDKELTYRQQIANFIQDMGQRLQVTQLCINTAIVYMHRFYMFHSFTKFNRHHIAAACLFLAAKVEEQPRKLEHVIKVAHMCLHREGGNLDVKSTAYLEQAQDLVINENILLQSLGFDITVDHPHTHVVKTCQLVRASKDLAQTSYFLATNSLHLTNMSLLYQPTVVACVCIHLACKWSHWEIPRSSEGKEWFWYTDRNVTLEMLEELTQDFLDILEKCPSKLKKKILTYKVGLTSGKIPEEDQQSSASGLPVKRPPKPEPCATATSASTSSLQPNNAAKPEPKPSVNIEHKPAPSHTITSQPHHPAQPVPTLKTETTNLLPPPLPKPSVPPTPTTPEGLRRVKTEPTLSLTPKEYRERREREKQQAQNIMSQKDRQQQKDRHAFDVFTVPKVEGQERLHSDQRTLHHQHGDIHRGHDTLQQQTQQQQKQQQRDRGNRQGSGRDRSAEREGHHSHPHHKARPPHPGEANRHEKDRSGYSMDPQRQVRDAVENQQRTSHSQHRLPQLDSNRSHQEGTSIHHHHADSKPLVIPPKPMEPLASTIDLDVLQSIKDSNPFQNDIQANPMRGHIPDQTQEKVPPVSQPEPKPASSIPQPQDISKNNDSPKTGVMTHKGEPPDKTVVLAAPQENPSSQVPVHKELKIKLSKQPHTPEKKPSELKLKISLGSSPSLSSKRSEEFHSPSQSGGDLKVRLDLKSGRVHDSPTKSSKPPSEGKSEYRLHNQAPLKLVLSKGKIATPSSPGSNSSHKSSRHHHHHHHHSSSRSNGDKSHSRKRPRSPHGESHHHRSSSHSSTSAKLSRTDSFSSTGWPENAAEVNGSSCSNTPPVAQPQQPVTPAHIEDVQRQLQQLIALQQAQIQQLAPPPNRHPIPPPE